jgi:hypothetical protein
MSDHERLRNPISVRIAAALRACCPYAFWDRSSGLADTWGGDPREIGSAGIV